jgi:1-acyl-sn-glycerol-3-phosphate acyltransferase
VTGTTLKHRRQPLSGARSWINAILLNLTFYPLMALWTGVGILFSPLCLIIWKLVTGWDWGRIVRHLISIHGYGLVVIVSPWVRYRGEELEKIERPCILVVNHLSFFDSYFMSTLPFHDLIFAVGAWPFKMYWYTWFMRMAQYLDVESFPWSEVMKTCNDSFAKKGAVIFFPEGHRSRTGELQPFYSGAFRLSWDTGVPIVPLCITGTDSMLPPGRFFLHPTRVRLRALEPVHPSEFPGSAGHFAMRKEVRDRIERMLIQMQGESC